MEPVGLPPDGEPFADVRLEASFVRQHHELVGACARGVTLGAEQSEGALDADACEALDVQVETFRTLSNGIYYESKAKSLYAREVADGIKQAVEEFRAAETERTGVSSTRDEDVMRALVLLRRTAEARGNGRPRSRRFLYFLAKQFPAQPIPPADSPIILPGR